MQKYRAGIGVCFFAHLYRIDKLVTDFIEPNDSRRPAIVLVVLPVPLIGFIPDSSTWLFTTALVATSSFNPDFLPLREKSSSAA